MYGGGVMVVKINKRFRAVWKKSYIFLTSSGDLMVTFVVGLHRRFVFDLNPFRKFSFVVSTSRERYSELQHMDENTCGWGWDKKKANKELEGKCKMGCKRVWLEGDENLLDGKMVKWIG